MKIKELIKFLEQFNPDGEIVKVYDCMRDKLDINEINIYNGNLKFDDDVLITPENDEEKDNISGGGEAFYASWSLIIENKPK